MSMSTPKMSPVFVEDSPSPSTTASASENIVDLSQETPKLSTTIGKCCTIVKVDLDLNHDDKIYKNNNVAESSLIQPIPSAVKSKNCFRRYLGIGLGLCSCLTFSLAVLIVKAMPQYHPFSLGLWRFIGVFVFSCPILVYFELKSEKNESIFELIWPLTNVEKRKTFLSLILRGIFGATASTLQFCALTYMEVADCTVISFSTPIFVTLVAYFMLGEKCGIVPVFTAVMTLVGVIIIARPPFLTGAAEFDYNAMIGTILAFASMCFATAVFVFLRYLRKLNFAIVTTVFGVIGIIQSLIQCTSISRLDIPQNGWDWFLGSSIGILTFLGQLFLTSALKFENASSISLIRTCDVIFAFIWQLIFLNVYPDSFSLVGALVVISAVLLVGFRKWLDELPETHQAKQRLWFILK